MWQMPSLLDGMLTAIETERAMHLGYYAQLRKWPAWNERRRALLSAAQCGCDNRDLWFDLWMCGYSFWWRCAWLNHDEWRHLRETQAVVEQARRLLRKGGPVRENESAPGQVPIRNLYDAGRYFLSRMLAPDLVSFAATALRQETNCQMLRTAIGIKRYELRHLRRPSTAAALVPEFLPELPRDWMDGQPLRYRLNVDGTFALYSVGADGVDDGGDPTSRSTSLARWLGRDVVWPQPIP